SSGRCWLECCESRPASSGRDEASWLPLPNQVASLSIDTGPPCLASECRTQVDEVTAGVPDPRNSFPPGLVFGLSDHRSTGGTQPFERDIHVIDVNPEDKAIFARRAASA